MKIALRPLAREDILRQYRYFLIEKELPQVAARFLSAVQKSVEEVGKRPGIGVPVPLKNENLIGLRSWRVTGFAAIRVYYVTSQNMLRILRILHGKRDIHPLLENADESK